MIIQTKELQDIAQKILSTINTNDTINNTDQLQLSTHDQRLHLSVASDEFFVDIQLSNTVEESIHVVVNANVFLKLVMQITTESIKLNADKQTLTVKGNGTYTLPLLESSDGSTPRLEEIKIHNPVKQLSVSSDVLCSLLRYNAKQLTTARAVISPLQRVFYMDECGAITFTEGACINNFTLPVPVKVLLGLKLVKLFKLFQRDEPVEMVVGYDSVGGSAEIIQTKARFSTPLVSIAAILTCDDSMLSSYPANEIRTSASASYPYSTSISKELLLAAVNRLLLFHSTTEALQPVVKFEFHPDDVTISDARTCNKETVDYLNEIPQLSTPYTAVINLNELKATLDTCSEAYLSVHFGSDKALVIARGNVYNVIPQRGNA